MRSRSNDIGLVFNGEIYNYVELRAQLTQKGEVFSTQSDTEVLLKLFERSGEECVGLLRGMFAFAAWDDAAGRLTLARDRIGKKPLFYAIADGIFYFASTLEAIIASVPGSRTLDGEAIDAFFSLGYIPAPNTVFKEIRKLPAATVARLEGGMLQPRSYWSLAGEPEVFGGDYGAAKEKLSALLSDSVRIRLRSDVPLGVFLSGGIDSSLVTMIAARQVSTELHAFSIAFDEAEFDESAYAAVVARAAGVKHHVFRVGTDLFSVLDGVSQHFGEPFADASALPTWLLSERTRQHVTVAIGGDGGDEGFVGYPWYANGLALERHARRLPPGAARAGAGLLAGFADRGPRGLARAGRALQALSEPEAGGRFARLRLQMSPEEKRRWFAGALRERLRSPDAILARLASEYAATAGDGLRRMRNVDIRTYLADDLMPKVDVTSMAFALEVRAPLLDPALLEFGLSLPTSYLIDEKGGKRILRDLLRDLVPAADPDRRKQGFSVPLATWFRGPLRHRLEATLKSDAFRALGLFNERGIDQTWRDHLDGRRDHSQKLFALLVFENWLRHAPARITGVA